MLRDAGDLPDLGLLPGAAVDEVGRDGDGQLRVEAAAVETSDRNLEAGGISEARLSMVR